MTGARGRNDLVHVIEQLVADLAQELGGEPAEVDVSGAPDGSLSVALGGRPAVLGIDPVGSTDRVHDEVAERLLRRLSLVLVDSADRPPVWHHLTDIGLAPQRSALEVGPERWEEAMVAAEELADGLAPDRLRVSAPARLVRRVGTGDVGLVATLRKKIFVRTGVQLPDLEVELTDSISADVRIKLNQVTLAVRGLPDDGGWADIVSRLADALQGRCHWFIRQHQVSNALDDLWSLLPDQVDACLACYDHATITACLRELVRRDGSVRNIRRVVWLLLDLGNPDAEFGSDRFLMAEAPLLAVADSRGHPSRNPVALAARVRKRIREEAWRVGVVEELGRAGRLAADVEDSLTDSDDAADTARAEWRALQEFVDLGRPQTVVVRSIRAIAPVFNALQADPHAPKIMASQELPPDYDLSNIGVARRSRLGR